MVAACVVKPIYRRWMLHELGMLPAQPLWMSTSCTMQSLVTRPQMLYEK